MPLKRGGRERRQITDGPYPQPVEAAGGHRAHTPQSLDRQWVEELEFTGNLDHDDSRPRVNTRSVSHRFGRFRRQLRQQLVRCHSYRTGQMQVVLHTSADVSGDARAIPEQAHRPRHIEKRLVDGDPFDQRRHRFEDGVQFGALFHVTVVSAVDEYGLRTQSAGDRRGHGGMDTEHPGLVGAGSHDTSAAGAPHNHRASGQGRIVQHLHRGKERIHVGCAPCRQVVDGSGGHPPRRSLRNPSAKRTPAFRPASSAAP